MEMPIPQSQRGAGLPVLQGTPTRVGARFLPDGGKERYCKKCGAGNGADRPAKTSQAKKSSS